MNDVERPPPTTWHVRLPVIIATVATALWTCAVSWTYLVNTEGPMGGSARWAPVVALAVTGASTYGVHAAMGRIARRSKVGGAVCAVVIAGASWVLAPTVVDKHESFVDRPNRTATCSGWEYSHYPPDTSDGSSLDYCVGVEHLVAG